MFLGFALIWFLREVKAVLFWLYLWQLKEYHIGRFLAHFHTAKGKRLLLNPLVGAKLALLGTALFFPAAVYLAPLLYMGELLRQAPRPVLTRKIQFLSIAFLSILFAFVLLESLIFLLIVDILTPFLVSIVVLALQPFVVFARNRIIRQAKNKRAHMRNLKVVGITGSYGKTTTKEFLAHILSQKFRVLKTPEHANSEVGISRTILNSLTDEHEIFVCEMGAYSKGGIALLAGIAKPEIGIVTGVNEQHLATFGTIENLLSAEGGKELLESLPGDGVVVINPNSKIQIPKSNAKSKIVKPEIPDVRVEKDHISFELEGRGIRLNVIGAYNIENFVLAAAVARGLGMTPQEIAEAAKTISQDYGAMELRKGAGRLNIIDSTYSANPDGVIAALEYLKVWKGRKVIVMPCMIELGQASKEAHERVGKKIGEACDLAIITTKEHFEDIKKGAVVSGGMEEGQILFRERAQEIFDMIRHLNQQEDVILLESRLSPRLLELLGVKKEAS